MRRRQIRKLLTELREHIDNGVPHCLMFKPTAGMTKTQKEALQDDLNRSFDLWRQTWLLPWIDMLEQVAGVN